LQLHHQLFLTIAVSRFSIASTVSFIRRDINFNRIDHFWQSYCSLDIDGQHLSIDAFEPSIDATKPSIDAIGPSIDAIKPSIDAITIDRCEYAIGPSM
jgi:hypothetical protein